MTDWGLKLSLGNHYAQAVASSFVDGHITGEHLADTSEQL